MSRKTRRQLLRKAEDIERRERERLIETLRRELCRRPRMRLQPDRTSSA